MTDLASLAVRARTALADARSVTLVIRGVGRIQSTDPTVMLHDRDGYPTFLCQSGSPVTQAAARECSAVLTVVGCDETGALLNVMVSGRLACLGSESRQDELVDVVGLVPSAVWVEEDDPSGHHVVQHAVPIELYTQATPDLIARCARRVAAHTTHSHQAQLRAYVAEQVGVSFDEIAGVTMSALHAGGAELQWVDLAGSHCLELAFSAPARTPRELALKLRARLDP